MLAVGIAVVATIAALVAASVASGKKAATVVGADTSIRLTEPGDSQPAPDLSVASDWDNTPALTNEGLKGKVVLVDFWDASCINCRRTFPFLQRLAATYEKQGLVILGVHSPEFDFEKANSYVVRTARELGVTWPVANDPEMQIWNSFSNQYWPANYFIDRDGRVRGSHFGEGDEDAIETAIRTLLEEGGSAGSKTTHDANPSPLPEQGNVAITPELYVGTLREAQNPAVLDYTGSFDRTEEYRTFTPGSSVELSLQAKDVYAVLGGKGTLRVTLDGKAIPADQRGSDVTVGADGSTQVVVDKQDLFHLLTGTGVRSGTLTLYAGSGVQLFTFTFGS